MTRLIRARTWCLNQTRPSISLRAARARASQIPESVCWSAASAMPTSPSVFRATGCRIGRTLPRASTGLLQDCILRTDAKKHGGREPIHDEIDSHDFLVDQVDVQ